MTPCRIFVCSLLLAALPTAPAQNYRERDLSGSNLQGATLEKSDLTDSNLDNANLSGANLEGAEGERTLFRGANLAAANLRRAKFPGGQFQGAQAIGADFTGANLRGASFAGANLSGANFEKANLNDANFRGAKTDGANFDGAKIRTALFDNAPPDTRSRAPERQEEPPTPASATRTPADLAPPIAFQTSPEQPREPRSIMKTVGGILWPFGGSSETEKKPQDAVPLKTEYATPPRAVEVSPASDSIQPEERKFGKATLDVTAIAIDQGNLPVNALRIEMYDVELDRVVEIEKTDRDGQAKFKERAGRRYILRPLPARDEDLIFVPAQIDLVLPPAGATAKFGVKFQMQP